MIIEFIGPSGSGKSTLMPIVAEFFRQNGAEVYTRWDARRMYAERSCLGLLSRLAPGPLQEQIIHRLSLYYRMLERRKFEATYADLIELVRSSQRCRPPEAGVQQRRVLHYFNNMIDQYCCMTALKQPGDVLIFEEGFVHRVVQLNVSSVETPDPDLVTRYLDLAPLPDFMIHIDVPDEVCAQRVIHRGPTSYMASLSSDQMQTFFANTRAVISTALGYLQQKGCPAIRVDNGQNDPVQTAEALRNKLSTAIVGGRAFLVLFGSMIADLLLPWLNLIENVPL